MQHDPPRPRGPATSGASTFAAADGNAYELQMGRWSRRLAPLFVEFAGIGNARRVLDVGCGTGNLALFMAQRDPTLARVHGIDVCPAYVEYARRRSDDARLQFHIGDACALPFSDGTFDHALAMLALQFMPRAELAVHEMRRVTRPGGIVAAATWDTRGGYVAMRLVLDAAAMLGEAGRVHRAAAYTRPMSRPGDLARVWADVGLKSVRQDSVTIRMEFGSFADFWAPVTGTEGPLAGYVAGLGLEDRARLREAVRLAYLDGETEGPRSFAATAWVVRGAVP
ncbi:MAG: methyltransferase domain-containing protein [Burkholderiales bacterium]|nr:methyltransferase domain-containing protein [Burkholderiales bacterium]